MLEIFYFINAYITELVFFLKKNLEWKVKKNSRIPLILYNALYIYIQVQL